MNFLTLPDVSSTLAYIAQVGEDVSPYLALIIGLPLAFWFVGKVVALVRGGFRTRYPRA
jgi:hypothetical protein